MAQRTALPSNPTVRAWASEPSPLSPKNLIPSTTGLIRRQDLLFSSSWDKGDHVGPPSLDRKTTNTQDPDKHKHRHTQFRQDFLPASQDKRRESVPETQPLQAHISTVVPASHHTRDLRLHKGATTPDRQVSTGGPYSQVHLKRPACSISHPVYWPG